ncbi:MAG: type II toxin-antitoxin system HicA family toxin [Clostridia bacterium]|nr:type II toxin-antitoxin system HicA family toxin [Clostridia bacterium]
MNRRKLLQKILQGSKNISFEEFTNLLNGFGFRLIRISGSHHIFTHPDINELVNIQNVKGQIKPYQLRQFLKLIEKNNLSLED